MTDSKKKAQQQITRQNVLESLKDLGTGVTKDFFEELVGMPQVQEKRSGELSAGESLQMSQALNGKEEENKKLRAQISLERNLAADERRLSQEATYELKVQLQALMQEVAKVAVSTGNLAEAAQIATIQAPANPGIYHILFFEKVLSFLQSFRQKINEASVWLTSCNKRAQKKNYWSMYKSKGSSFLLSPDHYLQRSAG